PMLRYWSSYPVPVVGKRTSRSLVRFLYNSMVPVTRFCSKPKSNPILVVTVVSHFKLGLAIVLEGVKYVVTPFIQPREVPVAGSKNWKVCPGGMLLLPDSP